jgi:hypothetical protein
MTLKKMTFAAALVLAVALSGGVAGGWAYSSRPEAAGAAPAPKSDEKPERWVEVVEVGEEICNLKQEMELTPEQAGKVFRKESPYLKADWRGRLPADVEPAPDARPLPDLTRGLGRRAKDATEHAEVLRFSPSRVVVVVLKEEGSELWHHYFDCLACLRLPRSAEVDGLLGVERLEKTYGAVYKGVKQGDATEAVVEALGKPDAVETSQVVDYFHYDYFKDDRRITFLYGKVQKIVVGVPDSAKNGGGKGQ